MIFQTAHFKWVVLLFLTSVTAHSQANLQGRLGNESIYFTDAWTWRSTRLYLNLRQESQLSEAFAFNVEGTLRYDPVYEKSLGGTQAFRSRAVRRDEASDSNMRELNLSWTLDRFRLKAGLFPIDWVDTLSPFTADYFLPLDLRFGGYGELGANTLPHKAVFASYQWLEGVSTEAYVALPVLSRLPKEKNGYGYFESVNTYIPSNRIVIMDTELPPNGPSEAEWGARVLFSGSRFDASAFIARTHQRLPRLTFIPAYSQTTTWIGLDYPQVTTLGVFSSASLGESFVVRAFTLQEPKHVGSVRIKSSSMEESPKVHRSRYGLGLDAVLGENLKVYSELHLAKVKEKSHSDNRLPSQNREEYALSYRVNYEWHADLDFAIDGLMSEPYRAYFIAPQLLWDLDAATKLSLGFRKVRSFDDRSTLDPIRKTSHYFIWIERAFSVGQG